SVAHEPTRQGRHAGHPRLLGYSGSQAPVIHWMLTRLEINPRATFLEPELEQYGAEFEAAKAERLVRAVGVDDAVHIGGRRLVVQDGEDGLEAFDTDDCNVEPVSLEANAVRRWRFDVPRFVEGVRERN